MDDALQLAAYAVILIIIGVVTVMKKVLEAQKQRKLLEAQQPKKLVVTGQSRGLTAEEETPPPQLTLPESPAEETETEPEPSRQGGMDLEDVLRRVMGVPSGGEETETPWERKLRRARAQVKTTPPPPPKPAKVTPETPLTKVQIALPIEEVSALPSENWDNFIESLNQSERHELERAIILAEIVAPPLSRRSGRQFWQIRRRAI